MAAYCKILILDALPTRITYTLAHTRNVYRMTVDKAFELLVNREGPAAVRDRHKLECLDRREKNTWHSRASTPPAHGPTSFTRDSTGEAGGTNDNEGARH